MVLPPPTKEGRPRADDRQTINGILYVLKTGIPWNDLPAEKYGDDVTARRRLKEWKEKGVWERIMDALVAKGYSNGRREHGDPLHRQRHHPGQKGSDGIGYDGHKRVVGMKVHAAVTEGSLPVGMMVSPANINEGRKLIPMMESISIEKLGTGPRRGRRRSTRTPSTPCP